MQPLAWHFFHHLPRDGTAAATEEMNLSTSPTFAPLRLPYELRLTPEPFELMCAENREEELELAADGRVIAITPTGGLQFNQHPNVKFTRNLFNGSGVRRRGSKVRLHDPIIYRGQANLS